MKQGYLTVYLSLTLAVMMSFIFGMVEGAKYSAMRLQIEVVTDMGMDSVFSEFHRELLEQYDLFFIDTSYQSEHGSVQNTADRLEEYMSYNFEPTKGEPLMLFYKDFLDLSVCNTEIKQAAFATDDAGAVFKSQAVAYMRDKYMLSYFNLLKEQSQKITAKSWNKGDFEDKIQDAMEELEEERDKTYEEEEIEEVDDSELEEYTDLVDTIHSKGILNLVVQDTSKISDQSVMLSQYVSQRQLNTGCGLTEEIEKPDGLDDELFFGEYLMEKYGCYTNLKNNSLLQYQLEYILTGKSNDTENLKSVVTTLLNIRAFSNLAYLYSDSAKQSEVKVIAAVLAIVLCVPEAEGLIRTLLNVLWAYGEAIVDIKTLLKGGEIPLIKDKNSWQIGLTSLGNVLIASGNKDQNGGISYQGYLRILLTFMNRQQKLNRSMDVIEMDIRKTANNETFRFDQCIDYLKVVIAMKSSFGPQFLVEKKYRYLE